MTNEDFAERFEQTSGTQIEKLFWIGGSSESSDLLFTLEDMEEEFWEKLFPEIFNHQEFEGYIDEPVETLLEFRKFGLLAELHIPKANNIRYEENDTKVFATYSRACCRVEYVYAETLEELMVHIEKISEEIFREQVQKDRKEKGLEELKFNQ